MVGHAFATSSPLKSLRHVAELNIVVHLGWQRKGIGSQLLDAIIAWAKNTPAVEKIQLNVRATNLGAIALYQAKGFEIEGRLKNHLKVGDSYIDDLIMGLDIRSSL